MLNVISALHPQFISQEWVILQALLEHCAEDAEDSIDNYEGFPTVAIEYYDAWKAREFRKLTPKAIARQRRFIRKSAPSTSSETKTPEASK